MTEKESSQFAPQSPQDAMRFFQTVMDARGWRAAVCELYAALRSETGTSAVSKDDLIRAAIACEQIWAMDLGERLREAAELARVNEAGENLHAKLRETEAALAQSKHDLAREVTIAAHECAERVRLQGELAKARMVLEWAQQNIDCVEDADERKRCSVAIDAILKSPAQGEKINAAGRGRP